MPVSETKTTPETPFEDLALADMVARLEAAVINLENAANEIQERTERFVQRKCVSSISTYTADMASIADRVTTKTAMFQSLLTLVQSAE